MNEITEKFIQEIPGWLEIHEARFLEKATEVTKSLKGEIVEIGSFCGKSTISLAQSGSKVYAIDPHKGNVGEDQKYAPTYKQFLKNLRTARILSKVEPRVATSLQASKKWKKPIRTLFIDGLHDEKHAEQDFKLWSPHVVNNGIIAVHDSFCRWCGSEKVAVKNVVRSDNFYKIGVVGSIIYGVKGKGTSLQRVKKFFYEIYVISRIELNHLLIIVKNLFVLRKKTQNNFHFS